MADQEPIEGEEEFLPATKEESVPVETEEPFGDLALTEDIVSSVERAVELKKRMDVALLRLTKECDWTNIGGVPYLKASGCESLADALGVSWGSGDTLIRTFNDNGKFVEQYLVKMWFRKKGGRSIQIEGVASTDDDFFSKKGSIPFEEIDRNSVRKKAETNGIERGISKLLGLRGITWDIIKAAGLDVSKINTVSFKGSKEGYTQPVTSVPATPTNQGPSPQLDETRIKMSNYLLDLSQGNKAIAMELCKKYSYFEVDGKGKSFDDPMTVKSEKWLYKAYGNVKRAWETLQKLNQLSDSTPQREPGQEG